MGINVLYNFGNSSTNDGTKMYILPFLEHKQVSERRIRDYKLENSDQFCDLFIEKNSENFKNNKDQNTVVV